MYRKNLKASKQYISPLHYGKSYHNSTSNLPPAQRAILEELKPLCKSWDLTLVNTVLDRGAISSSQERKLNPILIKYGFLPLSFKGGESDA